MSDFTEDVYAVVRRVPHGRVVSYGGVAALLGKPRAARGVGWALCVLAADTEVPWWRVINRLGEISTTCIDHTATIQRALLEAEGVEFDGRGRVDWRRFGWVPEEAEGASGAAADRDRRARAAAAAESM